MDTLGSRLRRKRRERGWTQEELALRAGTNQAVIQKIENGKCLRPRKIDEIAQVLDVNPAWLMFGEEANSTLLDEEATEVAKAWNHLPEPIRSRIKRNIFEQVLLHSNKK
jgi:transcriptional regulator with XRE-family HTH domain